MSRIYRTKSYAVDCEKLRDLLKSNKSHQEIADELGISRSTVIRQLKSNPVWNRVKKSLGESNYGC